MFARRFKDDNWQVIFFEALREEYWKKGKKDIFSLIDKKIMKKTFSIFKDSQPELFN